MLNDDQPTINERIAIGLSIIQETYPEAVVCVADGKSRTPTLDPNDIFSLRVVCADLTEDQTIIIRESGPGEFLRPTTVHSPWTSDIPITDLLSVMDIAQAQQYKEDAGYKKPYVKLELRCPNRETATNPYFIFTSFGSRDLVFVDVITGEVHIEQ